MTTTQTPAAPRTADAVKVVGRNITARICRDCKTAEIASGVYCDDCLDARCDG
jgi:hypothetical protein